VDWSVGGGLEVGDTSFAIGMIVGLVLLVPLDEIIPEGVAFLSVHLEIFGDHVP
jgi:hypothetical protein